MYKNILFLIVVCVSAFSFSQQLPISQQNYFNNYSLQPAYTGQNKGLEAWVNFRSNMLGYSGKPSTTGANVSYRKGEKHGFGGSVMTDQVGLIRNNMLNFSYAYRLKVSAKGTLSAGFSAGIVENRFDFASAVVEDQTDIGNMSNNGKLMYNVGFGLAYSSEKLTLGVGLPILFNSRVNYTHEATDFNYQLRPTYTLNGSYVMDVSAKFEVIPTVIARGLEGQDMLNDYILRFRYDKRYSIATGYRSTGVIPVNIMVGLTDNLNVYYGHDLAVGKLANLSNGGFEIGIGYKFTIRKADKNKQLVKELQLEKDSLNLALQEINDSLRLKMDALVGLDSVKVVNQNLNKDVDSLRNELKNIHKAKTKVEEELKNEVILLEEKAPATLEGKNTVQKISIDKNKVLVDEDAGFYVVVESSVDREALEKALKEWSDKEPNTFIIKRKGSKWYNIGISKHNTKAESLNFLNQAVKKYGKAWISKQ